MAEFFRGEADGFPFTLRRRMALRYSARSMPITDTSGHETRTCQARGTAACRSSRRSENRLETFAEDLFPLLEILDIALGGPGFESLAAAAIAHLAAFDVDQQIGAVLGVDDEVEAFEFRVGEERFFGFIDGDVGDSLGTKIGLEGGFVMDRSVGHGGDCLFWEAGDDFQYA